MTSRNQHKLYVRKDVGNKPVYVVEDHASVLAAWADIKRAGDFLPLVSLDYHTDTRLPFITKFCQLYDLMIERERYDEFEKEHLMLIDYKDEASILAAVTSLKHDEHIRTALRTGIVSAAYVINPDSETTSVEWDDYQSKVPSTMDVILSNGTISLDNYPAPEPPYTYRPQVDNLFLIRVPTVDDQNYDQAIESSLLDPCIRKISDISTTSGSPNPFKGAGFVLDIDLDYFNTANSICPKDITQFYRLLSQAKAITIATEPEYVEECKVEGEKINSIFLLKKLLAHIRNATH
jgi:hypothetical protein